MSELAAKKSDLSERFTKISFFMKSHRRKRSPRFVWAGFVLIAILISVFFKVYIFEVYRVSLGSMQGTILPSELVVVSKFDFSVNYNKIVVFNSPANPIIPLIKRCVGLPGDTLIISQAIISVNGKTLPERSSVINRYEVTLKLNGSIVDLIDSLDRSGYEILAFNFHDKFVGNLNDLQLKNLQASGLIEGYRVKQSQTGDIFPHSNLFQWTKEDFGPVVIPAKGTTITLNPETYSLYNNVIERFEDGRVLEVDNRYYKDGEQIEKFQFKNDYFFFVGDNRPESNDSRSWGFVPRENVIGVAWFKILPNGNSEKKGFRLLSKVY